MADGGGAGGGMTFEGRSIAFREGWTVAAALIAAGERGMRETADGGLRSVFCGMGVCQDCLVEIDGAPNQRACLAKARPGLAVRRQAARARLDAAPPLAARPARVLRPEVLVIGGGAGGLSAAVAAASAGAEVVVLDERAMPGGQYYKQAAADAPLDAQQADGAALIARARAAGATVLSGVELWGAFDGPVFAATEPQGALVIRPRAVVIATGVYERPAIVRGWEAPGVMTTGAAQTLWRSHRALPGARVLVAGNGPLNAQVALELARGGAQVAALAEAAPPPRARPAAALRLAAADPTLAAKGARLLAGLAARGVPLRWGARLARVEAVGGALRATLTDGARFDVDAVLTNEGFQPSNEALRLLGCAMAWDARFSHLRVTRDADMQTSVAGVFAVGDCCGLGGAPAAEAEGAIAGAAAARAVGRAAPDPAAARRALKRARAFQSALWALYAAAPRDPAAMEPETLVCRCEGVRARDLDAALATPAEEGGPADIGAVKRATRLGMGRCQGRYCGPPLAELMAARRGEAPGDLSFFAPRAPIKPVRIADVLAAEAVIEALRDDG